MRSRRESGFTLLEVVIASLLLLLVVSAALPLYYQGVLSWRKEKTMIEVLENVRIGLDRISRELRTAVRLVEAGDNAVKFVVEVEDDAGKPVQKTVRYYRDAERAQLMREVGGGVNPVASYITGLSLTYEPPGPGEPEKKRLVRITLTGEKDGYGPLTLSTSVCLRV